jgi:SET domain-containing protein
MIKTGSKYKSKRTFLQTNPKLEVRDTGKYGLGVFAGEDIKKGKVIRVLSGETISLKKCLERIKDGNEDNNDPLQVRSELYVDLDFLSHAFNHGCNPNAGLRKRGELFAIRKIKKSKEITYDYSMTVGPNNPPSEFTMKCGCGSKKCRKIIGNILTIPKKTLQKYKKLGAFQDYIKDEFEEVLG